MLLTVAGIKAFKLKSCVPFTIAPLVTNLLVLVYAVVSVTLFTALPYNLTAITSPNVLDSTPPPPPVVTDVGLYPACIVSASWVLRKIMI